MPTNSASKSLSPASIQLTHDVKLDQRESPELVFGLVGPIGSGVSTTGTILKEVLEREFGYKALTYKVSDIIRDSASHVKSEVKQHLSGAERVTALQTVGNDLRERFGSDYLVAKCIEKIAISRLETGGYLDIKGQLVPMPVRCVHIIDSIKNPAEVALLRRVYGQAFWLIAVFAPEDIRRTRLIRSNVVANDLDRIILRDENEADGHGQKVRDTSQLADFFVRNDGTAVQRVETAIHRYLDLIFGVSVLAPTKDESAMAEAMSAAARSACLSRQVGAVIVSQSGDLIGVGWNDVPKYGGGLYVEEGEDDGRCFHHGGKICHNDFHKEKLYQQVWEELRTQKLLKSNSTLGEVTSTLRKTDIRNLIEYSRSVHAEMEAIISVARSGKGPLENAVMYCTTYPCHSCARHIVASGITRVIYIEPYPKSLALTLHDDAISGRTEGDGKKVRFLQYEGVAPKNVQALFGHGAERKINGKAISRDRKETMPVARTLLDSFPMREQLIVQSLQVKEQEAQI